MAYIRAEYAPDFRGEDVVLLAMDGVGVSMVTDALEGTRLGVARLSHDGVVNEFVVDAGAAAVEFADSRVTWRLDPGKIAEMLDKLRILAAAAEPGHHYVDIVSPTTTLVLSRDEYAT